MITILTIVSIGGIGIITIVALAIIHHRYMIRLQRIMDSVKNNTTGWSGTRYNGSANCCFSSFNGDKNICFSSFNGDKNCCVNNPEVLEKENK